MKETPVELIARLTSHQHRSFAKPAEGVVVLTDGMTPAEVWEMNFQVPLTQDQAVAYNALEEFDTWATEYGTANAGRMPHAVVNERVQHAFELGNAAQSVLLDFIMRKP